MSSSSWVKDYWIDWPSASPTSSSLQPDLPCCPPWRGACGTSWSPWTGRREQSWSTPSGPQSTQSRGQQGCPIVDLLDSQMKSLQVMSDHLSNEIMKIYLKNVCSFL